MIAVKGFYDEYKYFIDELIDIIQLSGCSIHKW